MKSQDIIVVLALASFDSETDRNIPNLSRLLGVSTSTIHASLERLARSGLIRRPENAPIVSQVQEFLESGLRFVFPADIGRVSRGVPTASSAPPLNRIFNKSVPENEYVWPTADGHARGASLAPLHKNVPEIATRSLKLYELLAIADALRISDPRVRKEAIKALRFSLNRES